VGKDNELKIPTVWQEVNNNRSPEFEKNNLKSLFYQILKLTAINYLLKNMK
jgi:hypothetical protein